MYITCDETHISIAMKKYMRVALSSKRKKKKSVTTGSKVSPEKTAAEKALSNYLMVLLCVLELAKREGERSPGFKWICLAFGFYLLFTP